MANRIPVFLNAKAGATGERAWERIETLSTELSREPAVDRVELLSPDALSAAVQRAVAEGQDRVIVGGGDGTLSTAAAILAGTNTALGVLPLGTLNHFARDARIPVDDWREAAAIALADDVRAVDLGEVNGRTFLNTCSLGGYVNALRRRERLRRRASHGKTRAMFWGTVAVLKRVPRLYVTLSSAERDLKLRASFVLVSNNPYQDDVIVSARRTRLDGGKLCVYTSRAHRYRDIFRILLEMWRVGIHQSTQLESWQTAQLEIATTDQTLHLALDGEVVLMRLPLRLRCRVGALRVAVPPRTG